MSDIYNVRQINATTCDLKSQVTYLGQKWLLRILGDAALFRFSSFRASNIVNSLLLSFFLSDVFPNNIESSSNNQLVPTQKRI